MGQCTICGNNSSAFDKKCRTGQICKNCMSLIPEFMTKQLNEYTAAQIREVITDPQVKKETARFEETCNYGPLRLNENRGTFCICSDKVMSNGQPKGQYEAFNCLDISDYGISIKILEAKKDVAYISVNFFCMLNRPKITIKVTLKEKVACYVERINSTQVVCKEPADLSLFRNVFHYMRLRFWEKYSEEANKHLVSKSKMEYFKAQCAFMLPDDFTKEELKKQRNRLLKVYHPDEAKLDENMDYYAEQINQYYNILVKRFQNN